VTHEELIKNRWEAGLPTTVIRVWVDDNPEYHVFDPQNPDENGLSVLPYVLEHKDYSIVRVMEGRHGPT
jgi:hypothetical protein